MSTCHSDCRVFPAEGTFPGSKWQHIPQYPLSGDETTPSGRSKLLTRKKLLKLLEEHRETLAEYPLVVTIDKDVLQRFDAIQNWNSGALVVGELGLILETLAEITQVTAVDIVGEWSPVKTAGI